jgi:hypothetical protein
MKFRINTIAALIGLVSLNTFAEGVVNLHDIGVATSSYNSFKSGSGDDPFSIIDSSYRSRYSDEVELGVSSEKDNMSDTFLKSSDYDILSSIKSTAGTNSEVLSNIYKSNLDDEGNFNSEAYADSYSDFIDDKRSLSSSALNERYVGMLNLIKDGSDLTNSYTGAIDSDISTAQSNLISLVNSISMDKKTYLNSILSDASSRVANYPDLASDTRTLAGEYAGCGDACYIPPPQDPPENPDPPEEKMYWSAETSYITDNCDGRCTQDLLDANPPSQPSGECFTLGDMSQWSTVISVDVRAQNSRIETVIYSCT